MSSIHVRHLSVLSAIAACIMLATCSCSATEEKASAPMSPGGQSGSAPQSLHACAGSSDINAPDPQDLTLALVPSADADKLVNSVKPITEELTKRLGIPVKGVVTQDFQAAVEAIGSGHADIGFLPSLQMSQACERFQTVPALQAIRNGKLTYSGQFYTNNPDKYCSDKPVPDKRGMLFCNGTAPANGPAGLDALTKIKGAKVMLLQPSSTGGYIYPVDALHSEGINLSDLKVTQVVGHDAAIQAVYDGQAEVGTSYWDARTIVAKDTADVGQKVVVFALTKGIPNDGASISARLSPKWQKKISDALLEYASTEQGKAALYDLYQMEGLAPADIDTLQEPERLAASLGTN